MSIAYRDDLGEFSSVVCLKAIITGMEEALGDKATAIALISAGRTRGKKIVEELGLKDSSYTLDEVTAKISHALGSDGTRLLVLDKLETRWRCLSGLHQRDNMFSRRSTGFSAKVYFYSRGCTRRTRINYR